MNLKTFCSMYEGKPDILIVSYNGDEYEYGRNNECLCLDKWGKNKVVSFDTYCFERFGWIYSCLTVKVV